MADRLSKIITKGGDKGKTSIAGGIRLNKFDPRIEAIGDIDELNSSIGVLLSEINAYENLKRFSPPLLSIQHDLFNIGGELAMPDIELLKDDALSLIEQQAEEMNTQLPALKEFILPSGTRAVSLAHMSRAICRRAERHLAYLSDQSKQVSPLSLQYINRLSDYLFILARCIGNQENQTEVLWQR